MAESNSPRLGLRRWSDSSTDTFSRAELDSSFAQLESLVAIFLQGTRAARPAAGTTGRFYVVTGDGTAANNGLVFYDTGSAWVHIGQVLESPTVRASGTGTVSLTVDLISGQTAHMQVWRNAAGTVLAYVDTDGDFNIKTLVTTGVTVNGNQTISGTLGVTGTTTLQGLNAGTTTLTSLRSTALRSDGNPKTQIDIGGFFRADGLIPPGVVVEYAGSAAPSGWAMCNGASYTTAAQPDLFAAIGYTFGGSGGNFNVPDKRDKFTLGATTTTGKQLGNTGGAHTKTLTAAHLVAHVHGHAHTHNAYHAHSASIGATNTDHAHYWDSGWSGGHEHNYSFPYNRTVANGAATGADSSAYVAGTSGGGGHSHAGWTGGMNQNAAHGHSVTVDANNFNTGGASVTNTDSTGSASPTLDVTPAYVAMNYIIKL